jgi:hypothetical protein
MKRASGWAIYNGRIYRKSVSYAHVLPFPLGIQIIVLKERGSRRTDRVATEYGRTLSLYWTVSP